MNAIRPYLCGSILDIGCGYGSIIRAFAPAIKKYVGIDHDPDVVDWLKRHFPEYEFLTLDIDNEPISIQDKFDTILIIAVLEHLSRPGKLVLNLPKLLKPGGRVVLTSPTPLGGWIHHLGGRLGIFSRSAADDHKGFYNRASLGRMVHSTNLVMTECHFFMAGMNQLVVFQDKR